MNEATMLRQRISAIARDARRQGFAELADRLEEAIQKVHRRNPATKEDGNESTPLYPLKEKSEETYTNATTRTREDSGRFVKPTIAEVAAFVAEKSFDIDPEMFWYFYESKGWYVGRVKMKSWKSACVTWHKNQCRLRERQRHIDAKMDERFERRHAPTVEDSEAVRTNIVSNAIANLTGDDWILCSENCAMCDGRRCMANHALPCDHRLNLRPVHPFECADFKAR